MSKPTITKQDEKDIKKHEKQFNFLAKMLHKSLVSLHKNIGYNNGLIENTIVFIKNEPMIFAFSQDPENRNFLKWALNENIKHNQQLLDTIAEIETEYELPTEHPDTPNDLIDYVKAEIDTKD